MEYGKDLRRFVCREALALGDSPAVGIIAGWPGGDCPESVCRECLCMLILKVVNSSVDLGVMRRRSQPLGYHLTTVAVEILKYQ